MVRIYCDECLDFFLCLPIAIIYATVYRLLHLFSSQILYLISINHLRAILS